MSRRAWLSSAVAALVFAAGCGGGSGGDDGASLGDTRPPTKVTAPDVPAPAPAGTGVVVIGGSTSSFAVTSCRLKADPAEPAGAQTLVLIAGKGTTGFGVGFAVEIKRFATGTDVKTFTDTVSYSDTARILEGRRVEVNGAVQDLRDPKAVSTLIRTRKGGASASGVAGPPGLGLDADGTVGFAIDATCAP